MCTYVKRTIEWSGAGAYAEPRLHACPWFPVMDHSGDQTVPLAELSSSACPIVAPYMW